MIEIPNLSMIFDELLNRTKLENTAPPSSPPPYMARMRTLIIFFLTVYSVGLGQAEVCHLLLRELIKESRFKPEFWRKNTRYSAVSTVSKTYN